MARQGIVYIVGAGPGRPDLITIRGLDAIKQADCIITDRLASHGLLRHARPDAEVIYAPKGIGHASIAQSRINELMIQRAMEGKVVVRLKGGDPSVFARTAEELAALLTAGIPFQIIPGVTAAAGAAAYAGIMLTDRRFASQVVFVTGHQAEDKHEGQIDWSKLANLDGTIVLYMAARNLKQIAGHLLAKGLAGSTPVAIIVNATLPTQKVIRCRLDQIRGMFSENELEPPAIIIIGQVAGADPRLEWSCRLPLSGRAILITRDQQGNSELASIIEDNGGRAIAFETVRTRPLPIIATIAKLSSYDWIVFTSRRGVGSFFEQLHVSDMDARALGRAHVAAIGPATYQALMQFGIKADLVPQQYTTIALARALIESADLRGRRILLIRSELADERLESALKAAGGSVEQVAAYTSEPVNGDPTAIVNMLRSGQVDWVTFASSYQARVFFQQIEPQLVNSNSRVASIGPQTSAELARLGVRVDLEAGTHTIEGLVQAIIQAN
ncbi:MAG: uroporphyrinogen-III C-methyltransferase [Sedimentisphaerales bacterium]|nr:uroporphyrinogen-III C-methyltransferase [Sedimentisphaerales bacterium]